MGYLEIPWSTGAISPLTTIDGQHRILGVDPDIEIKYITEEINKADPANWAAPEARTASRS
ncbi:MAG: hypothetical protein ACRD0K_20510 [Egibacteraceae bacterium]